MSINILNDKEVMLNREIGLIEFYRRVLAKTTDVTVPLLERLTYLCIVCKNCDELFEVRVARLLKWNKEEPGKILPDGLTAQAALGMVREAVVKLYDEIYDVYHNILIPELRAEKIYILDSNEWNNAQQSWAYNYFMQNHNINNTVGCMLYFILNKKGRQNISDRLLGKIKRVIHMTGAYGAISRVMRLIGKG